MAIKDLYYKVRVWWRFEARYYHRDFVSGIKNLIRWFPVIWKDRDWDGHFIWELMIQKLKFQAKYIGDRDWHVNAKRDAEIMMTCVRLMERVQSEHYQMEYIDYYEAKHEFVDTDDPEFKELKTKYISDSFDDYFKKYPLMYKRITKKYPKEDRYAIGRYMSYERHNRARRILFTLMERNIERWWE